MQGGRDGGGADSERERESVCVCVCASVCASVCVCVKYAVRICILRVAKDRLPVESAEDASSTAASTESAVCA